MPQIRRSRQFTLYSVYEFVQSPIHVEDPIYFESSIRVTIEHGHGNDARGDWSSTAYWYQVGRTQPLPDVGTYQDRMPYAGGGIQSPTRMPGSVHRAGRGKDRRELPR